MAKTASSSRWLNGARYGWLTVIGEASPRIDSYGWKRRMARCLCDCGKEITVVAQHLKTGNTKSCGCYRIAQPLEAISKFWQQVHIGNPKECWNWTGWKAKSGYGSYTWYGRLEMRKSNNAHRWAWLFSQGSIPQDMCVLHHCDNRACCNPAHLWLGTQTDNTRDCVEKRRHIFGERVVQAKLTEKAVVEARVLHAHGRTWRELGLRFGVDKDTMRCASNGKTWKHIL